MSHESQAGTGPVDAGQLSVWLNDTEQALIARSGVDVPCGDCTGCCRAAYFIHIGPEEQDALAHIPEALRVPAPGQPGHWVLGYSGEGHCPMLENNRCTIYAHRPETCRAYDCRVFAATGTRAGGAEKAPVNTRLERWRFEMATPEDSALSAALHRAAQFLQAHAGLLDPARTGHPTALALSAIKVCRLFLEPRAQADQLEAVRAALRP